MQDLRQSRSFTYSLTRLPNYGLRPQGRTHTPAGTRTPRGRASRLPRSQYSSSIHISRPSSRWWLLALSHASDAGELAVLPTGVAALLELREERWHSQLYAIVRTMPGFLNPDVITASSGRSSFMRTRLQSVMTCARG